MKRLDGRVAIVTGAGSGLGLAYSRKFAQEGARVILADICDAGAKVNELTSSFPESIFVKADVRSAQQMRSLSEAAVNAFGRIDVVVNNAALFTGLHRQPFEDLDEGEWNDVLDVNVTGTFNCIRAVTPIMKRQNQGKIINIASNVVHKGLPNLLHYVTSKGAIVAMTRALARELGPSGITVNAIAPGYVLHEGTKATDGGRNEQVVALRALGKTETPEDLLGTLMFLASADSDLITGQTIVVDGGEVFV